MRKILILLVLCGLTACERHPEKPATATPTPTPEPGYAGVPEKNTPTPEPVPAVPEEGPTNAEVITPAQVNLDKGNTENQVVKAEVLKRIDVMPKLTAEEKDKLYVQVERARGMGKIVTIPFSSGKVSVGGPEIASLKEKIKLPQIQKFSEDPTVVFVVLGFADKKGDPGKNVAISLQRAESVEKALKDSGVVNIIHSVGMGSSEMFSDVNMDKNRVVEVWAVLP
ncbi:hypothetical protein BH09VER1_BH09VER1_21100 [soil metagenome]